MSTFLLTGLAMLAFAANSILCRLALTEAHRRGSFTLFRLISGAVLLLVMLLFTGKGKASAPNLKFSLLAGVSLFGYAALFSFAYLKLTAGTGALLLFGAVQLSLLALYWWQGERFKALEVIGIAVSLAGFVYLMLPSVSRPDTLSAMLMIGSGVCWAGFTALGKQAESPSLGISWGFISASIVALFLSPFLLNNIHITLNGALLAIASGAIASGLGYLLWYQVMKSLSLLQAAVSQLSVPALALVIGALLLGESLTAHAIISGTVILGGIALVFTSRASNKD
ncbi:metabolite transporter superfamily [Vibrio ishigakensis]|uniref:Metabolite transporter superfamily n=1 Tax=Vibrio ishigakensis TaxID=1481914 RepID=A0A0B8PB09_9VIBR|nr:metabolite transporter superfamily [Vibrio ishigakensis]